MTTIFSIGLVFSILCTVIGILGLFLSNLKMTLKYLNFSMCSLIFGMLFFVIDSFYGDFAQRKSVTIIPRSSYLIFNTKDNSKETIFKYKNDVIECYDPKIYNNPESAELQLSTILDNSGKINESVTIKQ